ncbi:protein smoothened isoform X2 [Episyrphus balteatus]|uniref:protein smoothened isoform X2 n=1 Tax=Episyrphus balteatus TaxID=286459 RepID=UPI0024861EEB|nr:protein smoothened isoform X2 [Episyrphus balteatus]
MRSIIIVIFWAIIVCSINTIAAIVSNNIEPSDLEAINGTRNYRIYGKNSKDDKPWFDGRVVDMRLIQCVRPGKCEKLQFKTCFGANIPYTQTSLDLTDYDNQQQIMDRLKNYEALKHVPRCWAVIQHFLCAVFAPKCETINNQDMVYLPSLEMCKITLEPCRILYNTSYFPEFMKCNETLFPSKCNNGVREMKFNSTGTCLEPLVPAESVASYYPGIEGCGVQCKDPLYTDNEHSQINKMIGWGVTLCFLSNLFVVATFFIDWENANKYPALIVFYINLCFFIVCLGWLAQFTPGGRDDIVCRKDGTLRHSEPTAGENLSCIVVFIFVYYFLMAAMVWFVFLTYAWHLRAVGNVQDRIDKKGSYFHSVAWSLPLVLTITAMALSEVDGNSTVGICFVGYLNHSIRAGLLLGPLCGVILVGGYFIIRGMVMLFGLKNFANDIKSTSASNKIHLIIVRMGLCAFFTLIFILVAIVCHITEFRNSAAWGESLRQYIICRITQTYNDDHVVCKLEHRPSVAVLQLHLICLFGSGIVMSTWCWTPSSVETWKRYIRKKCGRELVEDIKMPKHKVIAQTWAKRKEFEDKGRLSITLYNTHTDPVGLNFDMNDFNSSATNDISSTWANYLPQFVKRRFAITGAATNSSSHGCQRKSSLDSEISFSVRHVSVESRRNSVDSQVSVKIAEMKTKVASRSRNSSSHHKHSKNRSRRKDFMAASGRKYNNRRESSTSVESQIIALKKTTYPNACHKVGLFAQSKSAKNMKRRSASAGLDPNDINQFLSKNGHFIIPFLQKGINSSSDEETSRASFKVQDSRLDVVLKQDLSDDDEYTNGAKIEELIDNNEFGRSSNRKSTNINLENFIKTMNKSSALENNRIDAASRNSRNSTKSRGSRKSTAQGSKRCRSKTNKSTKKVATADLDISDLNLNLYLNHDEDDDDDSISSFSLDMDLPTGMQSSYSGISVGKTHSRNSKTSCDVGIQANAYEIAATQTYADDELMIAMRHLNAKNRRRSEMTNDDDQETHELLPMVKNRETIMMSEAEKLKMLLLPSK